MASRECGLIFGAVIASVAKQSISPRKERMDCFAALAMTWTSRCHPSRHHPRMRVIQYPRDVDDRTETPQRTGCPAFPGPDASVWGAFDMVLPRSKAAKHA